MVVRCCECGDEPSGTCAMELVNCVGPEKGSIYSEQSVTS
jgi:hypothetical protein